MFDREFAVRTLHEVLAFQRRLSQARRIISYATLPFHWVPIVGTLLPKVLEETTERVIEHQAGKPFRWFYLISEFGGQ